MIVNLSKINYLIGYYSTLCVLLQIGNYLFLRLAAQGAIARFLHKINKKPKTARRSGQHCGNTQVVPAAIAADVNSYKAQAAWSDDI